MDRTEEDKIREAFEKEFPYATFCVFYKEQDCYDSKSIGYSSSLEKLNAHWRGYKSGVESQQEKIEEIAEKYSKRATKYDNLVDMYLLIKEDLSEKNKQLETLTVRNCRLVEECIELKSSHSFVAAVAEAGIRGAEAAAKLAKQHRAGGVLPSIWEKGEIISLPDGSKVIPNNISELIIKGGNIVEISNPEADAYREKLRQAGIELNPEE